MSSPVRLRRVYAGLLCDPSNLSLLVANLAVLALALAQGWDLGDVLWGYWSQSVVIGVFTFASIVPGGLRHAGRDRAAPPAPESPRLPTVYLALFFAGHYGLFHLVYGQFLRVVAANVERTAVMSAAVVFFVNHLFSFVYHWRREGAPEDPQVVFRRPYARIVPMHLTILLGFPFLHLAGGGRAVLALFLLLKTAVDLRQHAAEHGRAR